MEQKTSLNTAPGRQSMKADFSKESNRKGNSS
jgi:hypothetical protein